MSEERIYRGVSIRRRIRDQRPHGWWVMPEGPLLDHPDKGWVRTIEKAHAEIDGHLARGACLMREDGRWLGVLAGSRPVVDSMFDRTLAGFSAWCAPRYGMAHEPCSTRGCPCDCHATGVAG